MLAQATKIFVPQARIELTIQPLNRRVASSILARGVEVSFVPGEHGFTSFQVEKFTGNVFVLLICVSLKLSFRSLAETKQTGTNKQTVFGNHLNAID